MPTRTKQLEVEAFYMVKNHPRYLIYETSAQHHINKITSVVRQMDWDT